MMEKKEYVTKDSGERAEYSSGMQRDTNKGKDRPDLIFYPLLAALSNTRPNLVDYESALINQASFIAECVDSDVVERGMLDDLIQIFVNYEEAVRGYEYKEVLNGLTGVMTRGAAKYTPNNWKKAEGKEEASRFAESMMRHLMQYLNGEDDEDHRSAFLFNVGGLLYLVGDIEIVLPEEDYDSV